MTTNAYMQGRKKYQRPQAMLWADNPGFVVDGFHIPDGIEIGTDVQASGTGDFIILSDDNRQPIDFNINRIEKRERMVNGRMRSYHVADKLEISASWDMLPSRSFPGDPNFQTNNDLYQNAVGKSEYSVKKYANGTANSSFKGVHSQYTSDNGAGGVEMLDWYEKHQGPFWLYLSYDKYDNYGATSGAYGNLAKYSQVVEVYFADFTYSVQKRGGTNFDFWNISVKLEEV
jgi:hypothetical protein